MRDLTPPILCNETMNVLNYLKDRDYTLCISTLSENAHDACKHIGISVQKILNYFKVFPYEIMLFDDLNKHIEEAKNIGIHGILVNWETGITLNLLRFLEPRPQLRQSRPVS
jgi:hypothetical protein